MSKTRKNVSKKNFLKNTDIVFLLDRSGSMSWVEDATIKGYNDFFKSHQQDEGKVFVTTVLFDDQYELLYERKEIDRVEYMDTKTYYTRGCTALMDAVGKTITTISKKILKGERVIFVIITDGMENASVEYHKETVKKLIEGHSDWGFYFDVFLCILMKRWKIFICKKNWIKCLNLVRVYFLSKKLIYL